MKKLYPFQKKLKRSQESLDFSRKYRIKHYQNDRIEFDNGYSISIQCSSNHYCSPRESFEDPTLYDSYEIGIFYQNNVVNFEPLFGVYFEEGWIGAYVKSEKLQKIYDYISKLRTPESRKKTIDEILKDKDDK